MMKHSLLKDKKIRKLALRLIFWSSLVALFIISSIPTDNVNQLAHAENYNFRLDYLLHFFAYAVIGTFAALAYKPGWKVFMLLALHALFEEGHQYWIPMRTWNPFDLLYDILGITVSLVFIYIIQKKRLNSSVNNPKIN